MRAFLRTKRAGFMAGASLLTLIALGACVPVSAPGNGTGNYVICDDLAQNSNCPNDTAPVSVDNSL